MLTFITLKLSFNLEETTISVRRNYINWKHLKHLAFKNVAAMMRAKSPKLNELFSF